MKRLCILIMVVLVLSLSACTISQEQKAKDFDKNKELISNHISLEDNFEGIKGCAVFFDNQNNEYKFYNEDIANIRVSPYSTFKVMATLIGLRNDIIKDEQSKMNYNGTTYPIDVWNENLSLDQAFRSSCIWYFREVIDSVGQKQVSEELEKISYGNCDISEWDGSNTNPMPDLNGFWINSSLQISPIEQVNILAKIFEGQSIYSGLHIETLKNVMLVEDNGINKVYGKTGSGPDGKAWFIGFKEQEDKRYYFSVYLDDKDRQEEINGQKAKEIALKIIR